MAPNQPFALEHEKPYVTGAYEDAEVQFDWDLAAVTPLSLEHAAARWQRYFNQKAKSLADQRAFDEKEQMIQHELTRYMYIRWDRYGTATRGTGDQRDAAHELQPRTAVPALRRPRARARYQRIR